MAGKYNLIKDISSDNMISVSPGWCIAVVRFEQPVSFNRITGSSISPSSDDSVAEIETIIITDDCINMQVVSDKDSHVMSLSATLLPGKDYINKILPGDWVMAWMLNDSSSLQFLIEKIEAKFPCNNFNDGLKFIGRVYGLRKNMAINPMGGTLQTTYTLQGAGFSEFDSLIYYQPQLVRDEIEPIWLQRFGIAMNSIVTGDDKSVIKKRDGTDGVIDPNKIIPKLIRIMLGEGPFKNQEALPKISGPPADENFWDKHRETPNAAFLVPSTVGRLLGRTATDSTSGILSYADLVDLIIGVQNYSETENATDSFEIFTPDGLSNKFTAFKTTGKPIRGDFTVAIQPFSNVPVWSVLSGFLNGAVNEMYVALRASNEGVIVPTLIVRQLPFTSSVADFIKDETQKSKQKLSDIAVTKMLELPRWKAESVLVYQADVGRSDALRFNFAHLSGIQGMTPFDDALQFVVNPPIIDDQDIKRSGLRPYIQTTNCLFTDKEEFKLWNAIIADIVMGQHLTLTGTFVLEGIQAPICPGDNFEFEDTVYHIQSVAHTCGIGLNGMAQFRTTLQVIHGIANEDSIIENLKTQGPNSAQYSGLRNDDAVTLTPQATSESKFGDS